MFTLERGQALILEKVILLLGYLQETCKYESLTKNKGAYTTKALQPNTKSRKMLRSYVQVNYYRRHWLTVSEYLPTDVIEWNDCCNFQRERTWICDPNPNYHCSVALKYT